MKNKQLIIFSFLFYTFISTVWALPVYARTTPNFPSCLNPQGELKAKYDNGVHGIVGDTKEYLGSDAVYTISDEALLQCFCPEDGRGIQTNWWKANTMSVSEIEKYNKDGWILVTNGKEWGLTDDPYLAKNKEYYCKAGTGGGEIIALAATGNIRFIYGVAIAGIISVSLGLYLSKKHQEKGI